MTPKRIHRRSRYYKSKKNTLQQDYGQTLEEEMKKEIKTIKSDNFSSLKNPEISRLN